MGTCLTMEYIPDLRPSEGESDVQADLGSTRFLGVLERKRWGNSVGKLMTRCLHAMSVWRVLDRYGRSAQGGCHMSWGGAHADSPEEWDSQFSEHSYGRAQKVRRSKSAPLQDHPGDWTATRVGGLARSDVLEMGEMRGLVGFWSSTHLKRPLNPWISRVIWSSACRYIFCPASVQMILIWSIDFRLAIVRSYFSKYGGFLKWGYLQIIHFNRIFH